MAIHHPLLKPCKHTLHVDTSYSLVSHLLNPPSCFASARAGAVPIVCPRRPSMSASCPPIRPGSRYPLPGQSRGCRGVYGEGYSQSRGVYGEGYRSYTMSYTISRGVYGEGCRSYTMSYTMSYALWQHGVICYTTSFTWSKSCSTAAAMAGFPVPEEAGRSREGKKGKKGKKDVTFDFIEHV